MIEDAQRSPRGAITPRAFNRLLFALILIAALAVLARLVTRQESRAENGGGNMATAERLRTADALYLRGEWGMAADAYFGALEAAAVADTQLDIRVYSKLATSLYERGERRAGIHFMKMYRECLDGVRTGKSVARLKAGDPLFESDSLSAELGQVEGTLERWNEMN
jgi:hypothetical protein